MSISFSELIFYAFGITVLFLTPGPVWIAIISRSITGGLNGAVPLATGVAIGDIIWPTLAIAGSAALAASTLIFVGLFIFMEAIKQHL